MYLRHSTIRNDGKTHTYWRPVRSVRRGRKVVQETVARLGELDAHGRARARALALSITGRAEQYELFADRAVPAEPVAVRQVHLKQRLGELFALDYELLLYDLTSTYFEGEARRLGLASRGHTGRSAGTTYK